MSYERMYAADSKNFAHSFEQENYILNLDIKDFQSELATCKQALEEANGTINELRNTNQSEALLNTSLHRDRIDLEKKLEEANRKIEKLINDAKTELATKDKRISHLESECTRLYDPTKKFWNEDIEKKLKVVKEALSRIAFHDWSGDKTLDYEIARQALKAIEGV